MLFACLYVCTCLSCVVGSWHVLFVCMSLFLSVCLRLCVLLCVCWLFVCLYSLYCCVCVDCSVCVCVGVCVVVVMCLVFVRLFMYPLLHEGTNVHKRYATDVRCVINMCARLLCLSLLFICCMCIRCVFVGVGVCGLHVVCGLYVYVCLCWA